MSDMTIIRNIRGGWPQWHADLDDGRVLYVRIRYGEFSVGVGKTEEEADGSSEVVNRHESFAGVTDVVDALVGLRNRGFYYVAPPEVPKTVVRKIVDQAVAIYEKAFEEHWVVQDVIDAVRKLGE